MAVLPLLYAAVSVEPERGPRRQALPRCRDRDAGLPSPTGRGPAAPLRSEGDQAARPGGKAGEILEFFNESDGLSLWIEPRIGPR
jgi:hypothetical protein